MPIARSTHPLGGVVDRITIRWADDEHVDVVECSAALTEVASGPRPEQQQESAPSMLSNSRATTAGGP